MNIFCSKNITFISPSPNETPLFANKSSDVIIAPINLGAKLYTVNEEYKLAAVLTWGNLYFASVKKDFVITDMNDADVTFFGEKKKSNIKLNFFLISS